MNEDQAELIVRWYLDSERRLESFLQTVPYGPDTCSSFFPPLASIFLDSCSVLDAVFREEYSGTVKRDDLTMHDYAVEYASRLQERRSVLLRYPPVYLQPFQNWIDASGTYKPLKWWQDHNDLKHDRVAEFEKATLENCLHSLCALHQAVSQMKCFFQAAKRHALLHFSGWNPKYLDEYIYNDPKGTTILFESYLFATPVGHKTFPDRPEDIDPGLYGKGNRLWRFV